MILTTSTAEAYKRSNCTSVSNLRINERKGYTLVYGGSKTNIAVNKKFNLTSNSSVSQSNLGQQIQYNKDTNTQVLSQSNNLMRNQSNTSVLARNISSNSNFSRLSQNLDSPTIAPKPMQRNRSLLTQSSGNKNENLNKSNRESSGSNIQLER